jgi:hypothetical protein
MEMTINPRKTQSYRDLGPVDIAALQVAAAAVPEEVWVAENANKPNKFGALGQTKHIVFRFPTKLADWRDSYDGPLWAEWRHLLEPALEQATQAYGYQRGAFPRMMLARMPPGGVIHPHRDANPSAKWPHKIHVPIQTNPKAIFFVNGEARHLEAGHAVEVNNMGIHAVNNDGGEDRIHLIFEYYDLDQPEPDWIKQLMAARA